MKWAKGVGFAVSWGSISQRISNCCEAQLITYNNIKGKQMRTCLQETVQVIFVSLPSRSSCFYLGSDNRRP